MIKKVVKKAVKKAVIEVTHDCFAKEYLDLIKKATEIFDEVVILIHDSSDMITDIIENEKFENKKFNNISIDYFDGSISDYCKNNNIKYLVKALQNNNFEDETLMCPDLEIMYFSIHRKLLNDNMYNNNEQIMHYRQEYIGRKRRFYNGEVCVVVDVDDSGWLVCNFGNRLEKVSMHRFNRFINL